MTVKRGMRRLFLGALALAWAIGGPQVRADDGRDFAGLFETTNVVDDGVEVTLTLTVDICNYSGSDIANAQIMIRDLLDPDTTVGSFALADLPNAVRQRLVGNFSMPRSTYYEWPEGIPRLSVEFVSANGQWRSQNVELLRMSPSDAGN